MPAMFRLIKGKDLSRKLDIRNKKFRQRLRQEFIFAADDFIELIRSRYYRGRKGNRGLNRISHTLHNSWLPIVTEQGDDFIAKISADGVEYGIFHETGVPKKNLPQRTFVRRDLNRGAGKQIFTDAVRNAMKAAY